MYLRKIWNIDLQIMFFWILQVKWTISDVFSTCISYTCYKILLCSKTKRLPSFFRKKSYKLDILSKNNGFLIKIQNRLKTVFFGFGSWNFAHPTAFHIYFICDWKKINICKNKKVMSIFRKNLPPSPLGCRIWVFLGGRRARRKENWYNIFFSFS